MIGAQYPEHCLASHMNMISAVSPPNPLKTPWQVLRFWLFPFTAQEKKGSEQMKNFFNEGLAYNLIMSTKPSTIDFGLADSMTATLLDIYGHYSFLDGLFDTITIAVSIGDPILGIRNADAFRQGLNRYYAQGGATVIMREVFRAFDVGRGYGFPRNGNFGPQKRNEMRQVCTKPFEKWWQYLTPTPSEELHNDIRIKC